VKFLDCMRHGRPCLEILWQPTHALLLSISMSSSNETRSLS
jgi:hypothetical protein